MHCPTGRIGRRSFIGLGMAAGLAQFDASMASAFARAQGKAKQVLVLFEQGGVSHIDTWDPKPDAVAEHRSPFKTIQTNVPGINVTELLTHSSKHLDKLSLIRCMTQPTPGIGNSHPAGSQYIYSGHAPGGPVEMPDLSSVVAMLLDSNAKHLPSNIMVPGTNEQAGSSRIGFLPPAYQVFKTSGNLADPNWTVPNLGLLGIDQGRFKNRADLLSNLDIGIAGRSKAKDAEAMKSLMTQATDMLTNPKTRLAFDLTAEPEGLRNRYGLGHRGQCYLLGRKLIESGVRFVEVIDAIGACRDNWDAAHRDIASHEKYAKRVDQPAAALIKDLKQRGLLDDVLVVFCTEFGRTPWAQDGKGTKSRAHHPHAFSCWLAGAGIKGGTVYGETDDIGNRVVSDAVHVHDYHATILHLMGLDHTRLTYRHAGRDFRLTDVHGRVVDGILDS